jgi:hypothetical protein
MGLFDKWRGDSANNEYEEIEGSENEGRFSRLKKFLPGRIGRARASFASFLSISFLFALFMRNGVFGLGNTVGVKFACDRFYQLWGVSCFGKFAVYRISFSLVCFYALFTFLASRLFCVGDKVRLTIQYSWFILKIPLFLFLLVVPWFIPDVFFYYYAWVALFASGLFLVIQIILLIDFAYSWAESWRSNADEGVTLWDIMQLASAVILLLIAIALIVLSLVFFGSGRTCHLNRFFSLFTVAIGIILIIMSMAREKGLLPAAVVVAYGAFCVWSAMLSDPDTTCNTLQSITSGGQLKKNKASEIITAVFGILIAVFSLAKCTISTGLSFSSFFKLSNSQNESDEVHTEEQNEEILNREECRELFFSHLVFLLGSFYMAMVLVSWNILANSNNETHNYNTEVSKAALWVKIISQWLTFLLFAWSLLAPKILGRWRQFDED